MKNRWLERTAAVICALCLAAAVMSGPVFARAEEVDETASQETVPAGYVILDGASGETSDAEVTDNRTAVPCYVGGVEYGTCSIVDGVPYVDVTGFLSALGVGGTAQSDGDSLALTADGLTLSAQAGQIYFICNGRYLYVPGGVQSLDGQICLPVEALMKCLGISASWDQVQWVINVEADSLSYLEDGESYYGETDVYWLSRMIYAVAGDESLAAQAAVGDTVINRMEDDEAFAGQDTIYDVIFAKNQYDVVINGMIYMTPDDTAVAAAKLALEGCGLAEGATGFSYTDMGTDYVCVAVEDDLRFFRAA